jgi:hypothetical protein
MKFDSMEEEGLYFGGRWGGYILVVFLSLVDAKRKSQRWRENKTEK